LEHTGPVLEVHFSADGGQLVTRARGELACLRMARTGEPPAELLLPDRAPVGAVAFCPGGKALLVAGGLPLPRGKGQMQFWDAATGQPLGAQLAERSDAVSAVAFAPGGERLATATLSTSLNPLNVLRGGRGEVRLWDRATGKPVGKPLPHPATVLAMALGPDGRRVLTGCGDGTARLWDVEAARVLHEWGNGDAVLGVAFSPDGRTLLTGSLDRSVRMFDAETGRPLGPVLTHPKGVASVAFSPDGKAFATGCGDYTVRLWDTATRQVRRGLPHRGWVRALAFSPDGGTLLTGSADGSARLWDAATGKPIGPPLPHPGWVVAAAWSPDGQAVLTGGLDQTLLHGAAHLWRLPPPVEGDAQRIGLWAQVVTGMALEPGGEVSVLDAATWQQRRRELEQRQGPPLP
jgi:WD40 repeat protein